MPLADTLVSPLSVASEARDRFYRVQESLGHARRRRARSPGAGPPRRAPGPAPDPGASRRARGRALRDRAAAPAPRSRRLARLRARPPPGTPPPASPAAMASRNTMPNPSCTDGKQKTSAPTYSAARRSRETSPRRITDSPRPSSPCRRHQARILRPLSYDADLHIGDSRAEHGGGVQEILEALARVHARDGEHDGTAVRGPRRAPELGVPGLEVDRLGHDGEAIGGDAVRPPGHLRAIATRHHDEVGAARIRGAPSAPAA